MQARGTKEMFRRVYREITKEELPWISGRTITPKCRFSSGASEKVKSLPGSRERSRYCSILGNRGGLSIVGENLAMVRSVECLGGLRQMGVTHRPTERAATHGTSAVLPTTDEERHTEEFLRQERKKQAAKVMKTEQQVGAVAGESLSATESEFTEHTGGNSADVQKDIAAEMTKKSELGADSGSGQPEGGQHVDSQIENPSVDEEVKRGLVADSAFPIGRKEKVDETQKHGERSTEDFKGQTKVDVEEHGPFKTL